MSILNLFSLEHNYAQRRKPVPCLALSPIVHLLNVQNRHKISKSKIPKIVTQVVAKTPKF